MNALSEIEAVVPGYYLVCYNLEEVKLIALAAVVPGYYLVCYNSVPVASLYALL